jgi:hypothetical protein
MYPIANRFSWRFWLASVPTHAGRAEQTPRFDRQVGPARASGKVTRFPARHAPKKRAHPLLIESKADVRLMKRIPVRSFNPTGTDARASRAKSDAI